LIFAVGRKEGRKEGRKVRKVREGSTFKSLLSVFF